MRLRSLRSLYEYELQDLHDAETQLVQLLPRMAEAAHDPDLSRQLAEHGDQSRVHRERLGTILQGIDRGSDGIRCEGMRGILREAERMIDDDGADPDVKDAALLSIAQKAEHYEMAGYGALRTYAELLGEDEPRRILQETLEEEGDSDEELTRIATKSVNLAAHA